MKIDISIDDSQVNNAIARLIQAGADLTPVLGDIGEHLLNTTRQRFDDEEAPDGSKWAPLSEVTKSRKKRNVDKILTQRGYLRGALNRQVTGNELLVGSPRIYASTHQFGAKKGAFGQTRRGALIPWGDIPARPFLGLSDDDRTEIQNILRIAIETLWR